MKYQAVLFDLDGTLLDSLEDLADAMNITLKRFGFPGHPLEKYKYFVGDGMYNLVRRTIPPAVQDEKILADCVAAMKEEYGKRWAAKTRPYEGISELLNALKSGGYKMAVLSNKPHEFTVLVVEKYFGPQTFDKVFGERPGTPKKPDPAGALEIVRALSIPPQDFLYLGDTNTDMRTATLAGMYAVGVLWGFRRADELIASGAKTLIKHPLEVLAILGGARQTGRE